MLDIIFTKENFTIENIEELIKYESTENVKFLSNFLKNKYETIYEFTFRPLPKKLGLGLCFLHKVSETFIQEILKEPSIEFERGNVNFRLNEEISKELLLTVPYITGSENVDTVWLEKIIQNLSFVYNKQTSKYKGTIKSYINNKNNDLHIADKIYFHLVENDDINYPFAFMATYSNPRKKQKSYHTPLENALIQYEDNIEKLIELISTVIKISEDSELIKTLLESKELFKAIKLNQREATTFLNEVELYENHGIVCRIPNWWKKNQ